MDRKRLILIVLLLVWAGAALYAWRAWPTEQHAPLTFVKGRASTAQPIRRDLAPSASVTSGDEATALVVQLGRMASRPKPSTKVKRDLFVSVDSFRPKPPPPPPPRKAPPPPPPPPPPTPEELAAMNARKELGEFRYLGYLDKGGGKEQAFLSRGSELFTAQRGETIQGHFYVKDVTASKAVIVETGTNLEVSLALTASP